MNYLKIQLVFQKQIDGKIDTITFCDKEDSNSKKQFDFDIEHTLR